MKIAVLSGKGGTGKTLVSVNLAAAAKKSMYIDCDVEEPNGHLFFKPENLSSNKVTVKIPQVDEKICNGCRKCVDFCNYNALAYISDKLLIFDEICHSCGGCTKLCPQKALTERDKIIGEVQKGESQGVTVVSGILNTGEASGVPIIKSLLKDALREEKTTFIDCPPGSACVVMESIKDADYCVLVAEPTVFGVHNLQMVYELVKLFDKPHGVVLNKCLEGENPAENYCLKNDIPILGKIYFDPVLGKLNSDALISVRESNRYLDMFNVLLKKITEEVRHEAITNP